MRSFTSFPDDCLEDIFNHLSGKDLLKCTLVCPEWNQFIGTSSSCMKKIKLTSFPLSLIAHKRKKMFTDSDRQYENLHISGKHCQKLRMVLLTNKGNWKDVRLMRLWRANHFWDLLKICQFSVQKLRLEFISIRGLKPKKHSRNLQFP